MGAHYSGAARAGPRTPGIASITLQAASITAALTGPRAETRTGAKAVFVDSGPAVVIGRTLSVRC